MSGITEHLRLTILRVLSGASAYTTNSSILHSVTRDFGIAVSRDQIKTELAWLAEQGCVTAKDVMGLIVATLTDRGLDVAEGRCRVPGIQPPSPGG